MCERARLSRDPRFDGMFFTAVTTTGIFCRPVCPAPAPKPEHVRYFADAAAATAAGFRPCLRCRPELAPGRPWRPGDDAVTRALRLIANGTLEEDGVGALATRLGLSPRQLRRVFVDRLGAPPIAVLTTHRLLFAKKLLSESDLPITQVALAAGFGSVRRFNAAFKASFRLAPRDVRRRPRRASSAELTLRLAYRPPYEFEPLLAFLAARALPGVERVADGVYERVVGSPDAPGLVRVSAAPGECTPALELRLRGVAPAEIQDLIRRVRRVFDLDADPQAIADVLGRDRLLADAVRRRPGLRVPGGWDGFETAVRAVLGQQISVAAARTLAGRLVARYGRGRFPSPADLISADLSEIGLTKQRAATVSALAHAVHTGHLDVRGDDTLEDFVRRWTALPGVGAWTAHYVAMRAIGHPDAFPEGDLVLRRAISDPRTGAAGPAVAGKRALGQRAQAWRPWRAYAAVHLWQLMAAPRPDPGRALGPQRPPRRAPSAGARRPDLAPASAAPST